MATTKNSNRIITLNCGLGRDSITMLALLAESNLQTEALGTLGPQDIDVVIFSDTGNEWEHTYSLLPVVRTLCEMMGVKFVVLEKGDADNETPAASIEDIDAKAKGGSYHYRPAIMDDFESRATVASLGKGDCTCNHKILPIRRYIDDLSRVRFGLNNRQYSSRVRKGERLAHVTIIGIAADETSRLENGGNGPAYVTESYPLVDMGITKADEAPILTRWGLDHVRKSGCFMCPYQPMSWYWALSVTQPASWDAVVRYEEIALARNNKMNVTGIKSKGELLRLPELVARWRAPNPSATTEAVLDKQYSRCNKEARAQRKVDTATVGHAALAVI